MDNHFYLNYIADVGVSWTDISTGVSTKQLLNKCILFALFLFISNLKRLTPLILPKKERKVKRLKVWNVIKFKTTQKVIIINYFTVLEPNTFIASVVSLLLETIGFFCFGRMKRISKNATSEVDVFCMRYFLKTKQKIEKKVWKHVCLLKHTCKSHAKIQPLWGTFKNDQKSERMLFY